MFYDSRGRVAKDRRSRAIRSKVGMNECWDFIQYEAKVFFEGRKCCARLEFLVGLGGVPVWSLGRGKKSH